MSTAPPPFAIPDNHPEAIARRMASRATEFRVSQPHPFGGYLKLQACGQTDGSTLWRVVTDEAGGQTPARILNRAGLVEWERQPSDRDEDWKRLTRFTLEEACALIDRFGLWDARWMHGRGWVSASFDWVQQEQYVDPRVPGLKS